MEVLVISLFHETKIPIVDMKVQVSFNFSQKKTWKKIKSLSSMKNGSLNTFKCRAKFLKMGVLYTHSPKMLGPYPDFQGKSKNKLKKLQKKSGP
jgi:hypothetical protein